MTWQPTRFERFEGFLGTSTNATQIRTDAGPCILKALGNRQGPHELACEFVGSQLAEWMGVPMPDFAILTIGVDDEIQISGATRAQPGPAFVSRRLRGHTWGGDRRELQNVTNPADIPRMVVFDTWTRNCDRHCSTRENTDNVFIAADNGPRIMAIDHGHCFSCGSALTPELIESYNAGSRNIDDLFKDLVALSRDLSDEQQRHVREQLTEEELTVFDLLTRPGPDLSPQERDEVKKVARHLLERVRASLTSVVNWREKAQARAKVRLTIEDTLDEGLPRAYTPDVYEIKCGVLFEHVFETFRDLTDTLD